jgi:hypothetical protein
MGKVNGKGGGFVNGDLNVNSEDVEGFRWTIGNTTSEGEDTRGICLKVISGSYIDVHLKLTVRIG